MHVTDDIDTMLAEGIPFGTIEDRIEDYELPEDVKGMLWLYAWTWQSRDGQRHIITEMLQTLRA